MYTLGQVSTRPLDNVVVGESGPVTGQDLAWGGSSSSETCQDLALGVFPRLVRQRNWINWKRERIENGCLHVHFYFIYLAI